MKLFGPYLFAISWIVFPGKPLQPSLIFEGKAGVYPRVEHLKGVALKGRLLSFTTNIRLGLMGTNTLAYYQH
jgi:hypothetical protein